MTAGMHLLVNKITYSKVLSFELIFLGNVDNGSRNGKLHFADAQDSEGTLAFDLPKITIVIGSFTL